MAVSRSSFSEVITQHKLKQLDQKRHRLGDAVRHADLLRRGKVQPNVKPLYQAEAEIRELQLGIHQLETELYGEPRSKF